MTISENEWFLLRPLGLIACFYLRTEVAFLHFYAPACLDGLGYLLHRGEEHQHAYGCQHTAVYLTDGRSDETAYDEQEACDEGDVECAHGGNVQFIIYNGSHGWLSAGRTC